jgi:hypothetical protein
MIKRISGLTAICTRMVPMLEYLFAKPVLRYLLGNQLGAMNGMVDVAAI